LADPDARLVALIGGLGAALTLLEASWGWFSWNLAVPHESGRQGSGAVVIMIVLWLLNCLPALVVVGIPLAWLHGED
jgi:hypothetical protein